MKLRIMVLALLFLAGFCSPVLAVFCNSCGNKVADDSRFCNHCGKALSVVTEPVKQSLPGNDVVQADSYSVRTTTPAPQSFQVTSHYLLVGDSRIYRNSFFWIAEVSGSRARIWSVNEPPFSELVMGWVSLSELEKRSTLKPSATIVCAEPPPPVATIVVVERRSFWQRWGFGSRRGVYHGHSGHDHRRH